MIRVLEGKTIESTDKIMLMNELKFYSKNPRVYSKLRTILGEREPSQEEIFDLMRKQEHVRDLKRQIKDAGALREAVIVNMNTMEVVEGNSRLAAYRLLYEADPMKWAEISCEILPENITQGQIDELISTTNDGKLKWSPAEEAAWVWRFAKDEELTVEQISTKCNLNPTLLSGVMNFLYHSDQILSKSKNKFKRSKGAKNFR